MYNQDYKLNGIDDQVLYVLLVNLKESKPLVVNLSFMLWKIEEDSHSRDSKVFHALLSAGCLRQHEQSLQLWYQVKIAKTLAGHFFVYSLVTLLL